MTPIRIVCVGHAALDRVFTVDAWPTGSAKIVASRFDESGGGMAANAAVAAARLGAQVAFWGPTGDDATADVIEAQLSGEGVDVDNLRRLPGLRSRLGGHAVPRLPRILTTRRLVPLSRAGETGRGNGHTRCRLMD